jgi:CRP-like cAMP-binding protein
MTTKSEVAMTSIPQVERRRLLAASPLFAAFQPAELDRLASSLVERRYADRQTIFSRGDAGSCLMILFLGRVRVGVTSADGREILLSVLERGQVLGELALLDGKPRSADATALGDCLLLSLDRSHLLPVLRRSPEAALRLFEIVCARLRAADEQLEGAVLMSVPARLARLLLENAEGGAGRIELGLSQGDLARLIGASRQKVNLYLGRWLAEGVLTRVGQCLCVRNRDGLQAIAMAGEH